MGQRSLIMAFVRIVKYIDVPGIEAAIMGAAAVGVESSVQESVSWIKNDVLLDQKYIGDPNFPDVKPATKKAKRRKGNTKVLIDTGHYKDSWIGKTEGLKGLIQCGTDGYFGDLHKRWRIDNLWEKHHSKEALQIIEKSIRKVI